MKSSFWPKPFQYVAHVRIFLLALCVMLSVLVASIFFFLYARTTTTLRLRLHEQAETVVALVNHFRNWNTGYDGVFVEKKQGVTTNRYLLEMGIKPDLATGDGRVLTLRNHAIMAAEVSKLCGVDRCGTFRMVSGKPIDEENRPDPLEAMALENFEKGAKEFSHLEINGKPQVYRYLRPLYAERSCLRCHRKQGYQEGSVVGAISVTIPIAGMLAEMRSTRGLIVVGAVVTIALFVVIAYLLTWRLVSKLDQAQRHLKLQATTDELTGLKNRRTIMQRLDEEFLRALRQNEPLGIMIADVDFFKRINDTYGHPVGDQVLQQVAGCIRESVRRYDMVGRIGGEEFLIVSPGVHLPEALTLADRVRSQVAEQVVTDDDFTISVTLSVGLTMLTSSDDNIEALLKRADRALYQAKTQGRNRVTAL
jgi:diguanylate cyclase (GGDEF)-like protein